MQAIKERKNFSLRLNQLLVQSGFPASSPTWLAQEFNRRYAGSSVTLHAVRKWIQGESIPSQDKLKTLATWLSVSPEWLRYGDPPVKMSTHSTDECEKSSLKVDLDLLKRISNLSPAHQQVVGDLVASLQRLENTSR